MGKGIVEKQESDLAKVGGSAPAEMIREAISKGANLDQLEKLLSLQERWEANVARKIYAKAFASAQTKIEAVSKSKTNSQTHSKYAALENIIESAKPIYTEEGFAVVFYEGKTDVPEHIRICADVLHEAGHKETYFYDVPLDGKGIKGNANMTNIHAKASSTSYGRRYLMCMIWNIATQDDDGNASSVKQFINDQQKGTLRDLLAEIGDKNGPVILKYLGVSSFDELPAADYQKALTVMNARKEEKSKAGAKWK